MDDVESAFYLRLSALDEAGVLANITQILGDSSISIEAFIQKETKISDGKADIILLTKLVNEGDMNQAISKIEALDVVSGAVTRIRVENLS